MDRWKRERYDPRTRAPGGARLAIALILIFGLFSAPGTAGALSYQALRLPAALMNPVVEHKTHLPLIEKNFLPGWGSVSGKVINADGGAGVSNAKVCFGAVCSAQTLSDGIYQLNNLPAGWRPLEASQSLFVSMTDYVYIVPNQNIVRDFILTQDISSLGDVYLRIILTWDPTPKFGFGAECQNVNENDLDAHLWAYFSEANTYHVFSGDYGSCQNSFPWACLLKDIREGAGPETLDLQTPTEIVTYTYGVQNVNFHFCPAIWPPLTTLQPAVRIYGETGLMYNFQVPQGVGDFWYLFRIDDQRRLIPTNCLMEWPGDNPGPLTCP
jgi:hypothetical protein